MGTIKIIQVKNKRDFNVFLSLGHIVQKGQAHYISPVKALVKSTFDRRKNPFWKDADYALSIALKDDEPAGRIASILPNLHESIHGENLGYFGFFETIEDEEVVHFLLDAVKHHQRSKNRKSMVGPLNPSVNYELGILTHGFDQSAFFMMNYNPAYYSELLLQAGAQEEMRFAAYTQPCGPMPDKIENHVSILMARYPVKIEEIDYKNYDASAIELCDIYNDAFQDHWGFLPFSHEEFVHLARDLKMILDKKLLFKLSWNGEAVAFILAIPNLNEAVRHLKNGKITIPGLVKFLWARQKIKWVKVMVVAVKKQYQSYGLGAILYSEMAKRVEAKGYLGGEIGWVADNNQIMNKMVNLMGAEKVKEYAVYRLEL